MVFRNLQASEALSLERYADIDRFHESERYAHAESIPLDPRQFSVLRACLTFPSCTLSLVRTFPRLINGYDLSGRLLVVMPMDGVTSARVNGAEVGQSLILIKGRTNCTVLEPEARTVAILSVDADALAQKWSEFGNRPRLLRLTDDGLAGLQRFIIGMLELAARDPQAVAAPGARAQMQESLLAAFDEAMSGGEFHNSGNPLLLERYKTIVDRVDALIERNPIESGNEQLAQEIGISVRTMQTATQSVAGLPLHRYSRLKRLWAVRRQLRSGAPGLTVRASALAHGFWHISQFTIAYREAFGELPSSTLAQARSGTRAGSPAAGRLALNSR